MKKCLPQSQAHTPLFTRYRYCLFYCLLLTFAATQVSAQSRAKDPIVVQGSQINSFFHLAPYHIVGFKYDNNTWQQVPIQIDERFRADINTPYGSANCLAPSTGPTYWKIWFYADPQTEVGADPVANFDADDEIVFMHFDTGSKFYGGPCPPQVLSHSLIELEVIDPLNVVNKTYLYLFQQTGGLDSGANQDYVDYQFQLVNQQPLSNYPICENGTDCFGSPNGQCENSRVTTSEYESRFVARWVEDVLKIKTGGATGIDILDSHQGFIIPGNCSRNEVTFSQSRGPIVNAIDGPVRAIRSVMGSNSGTFNQSTIKFTKYRADYTLDFRVHNFTQFECAGFVDAFDFNTNATGMTYYNNKYPNGEAIDGTPDSFTDNNVSTWDLVDGPHGAIAAAYTYDTDIPLTTKEEVCAAGNSGKGSVKSYFDDSGLSTAHTCTGDAKALGTFGFRLYTDVCTDYRFAPDNGLCSGFIGYFTENRFHYYLAPNTTVGEAECYSNFAKNPLEVVARSLSYECGPPVVIILEEQAPQSPGFDDGYIRAAVSGGSGVYVYRWSTGDTEPEITNLMAGTYVLTVVDQVTLSETIVSTTLENEESMDLGIDLQLAPTKASQEMEIYPNPTRDILTLSRRNLSAHQQLQLRIHNSYGQEVMRRQWNLERGANTQQLSLSDLLPGLYYLQWQDRQGNKQILKFIKL